MGNGILKPIDQIEPGDYVLAHDLETGQWRPQLVLDQWSHLDDGHMDTVTIEDGTSVTATDHHQFWIESEQQWLELDQVEPGDQLLTPNGPVEVATLDVADVTLTLVWELTVATDHNFTVHTGTTDLLVHNQFCIKSKISDDPRLVREAEKAAASHQEGIDSLTAQLANGNLNPGIGTKRLDFGGISYARHRNGARVYFQQVGDTIVIVGKSNKANQGRVISILEDVYG